MRINEQHTKMDFRKVVFRLLGLIAILALLVIGYKNWPNSNQGATAEYFCGAEQYKAGIFTFNGVEFTTNCQQDNKEYTSGKASCKCEGDKRYGPTLEIDNLNPGDTVYVSLQYKSVSSSINKIIFSSDLKHYHQEIVFEGIQANWTKHTTKYVIPKGAAGAVWKIYPTMAEGNGPTYYDDINIGTKKTDFDKVVNVDFPTVEMQVNSLNFKKIKAKREEARKVGLLFSSKADLVNADLKIDGKEYSCLTRLKGDLLDHLRSDKWSFRVVLGGNETWKGMNIFSIHNSMARSHLAEWTMHQLMRTEGILTPKYDFMRFVLNGKNIGVYGYEQHFDNHFLTENQKLIGPIIRHNDEGYWDNVQGTLKDYEWAESSQVELFNKENEGNEQFMKLFHYGHSQLNDYLDGRKEGEQVFDLDKMAKYYALMEIGHGLHAQLMTNIRFYVNPTSGLLEPIGYDFFGDHLPNVNEHWRPIGQWENGKDIVERSRDGYAYMRRLFGDMKFFELYMQHLDLYASDDYLDGKLEEWETELKSRNDFINSDPEYANYKFDLKHLFRKAQYTRAKMYPMPNVGLKSYRTADKLGVILQGFHYFPLKVIGYKTDRQTIDLAEPILINAYSPDSPIISHTLKAETKPTTIIYQTLGLDSTFYHDVNNGVAPEIDVVTQQSKMTAIGSHADIKTVGKSHIVKTDKWTINKPYLIEKEEELTISKGTKVVFQSGGSLTIKGKILALGTSDEPISFSGNRSGGQGILISKGNEVSIFSHCLFSNLGNYGVGAVNLPSCINADEVEVEFNSCSWVDNNAQVDLVLSNTKYQITNCRFSENAGDAIHSIFSKGAIDQLTISDYGGQGVVQKGGRIIGKDWKVEKLLGWALASDLLGMISLNNYKITESAHSLRIEGSSEVVISGYTGKTSKRDIEVTGSEKPGTRVVISGAKEPNKLAFISEPGALLKINGSEKKTK